MTTSEGDASPVDFPIEVTAGDRLAPRRSLGVFTADDDDVETPVVLTGAIALVRKQHSSTSDLVLNLTPTVLANAIIFPVIDIPTDAVGCWWWDVEAQFDDQKITVMEGKFTIRRQVATP